MGEFENIFSKSDMFGMMVKATFKESLRKAMKEQDKDMRIAQLELVIECCNELLEEYKEK